MIPCRKKRTADAHVIPFVVPCEYKFFYPHSSVSASALEDNNKYSNIHHFCWWKHKIGNQPMSGGLIQLQLKNPWTTSVSLRFFPSSPPLLPRISAVLISALAKYTSNRPDKRANSSVRSVFLCWIASNTSAIRLYDTWTESKPFCHSKLSVLRNISVRSLDFAWSLALSDFWHPPAPLTRSIQGSLTCGQLGFQYGRSFDFLSIFVPPLLPHPTMEQFRNGKVIPRFSNNVFLSVSLSADRCWSMSILYSGPDICTSPSKCVEPIVAPSVLTSR